MKAVALKVDTDDIATRMAGYDAAAQQFFSAHRKMLALADSMSEVWEGKDQAAFHKALESFTPVLNDLSRLLSDYVVFMGQCVAEYDKTDSEIRSRAASI